LVFKTVIGMGHLNWKGEWISDESPFDKAGEYSLKMELIKELMETAKKYQGRIKDITIAEAANEVVKKYKPVK
jgi:hypothetical protein